jgi:hypothetical protein
VAYIACYRSSAGLSLADVSFIAMGAFLPRKWRGVPDYAAASLLRAGRPPCSSARST